MRFDAIIIGGGIIGCTTAYYLSRSGRKVLLIDRGEIASGTTANSFAWANASTKTNDKTYHDLNVLGQNNYRALAGEFGNDALGLNHTGALLLVHRDDVSDYNEAKDQAGILSSFGYQNEWLDQRQLKLLEPNMNFAADHNALFTPSDISVDAPRFTQFMAAQVTKLGGAVWSNCTALELLAADTGTITGLNTDSGEITAENIIIATGLSTAQTLASITGYDGFTSGFPMSAPPGLLLTTPPVSETVLPKRIIYTSPQNELHILPEFNGGLKIGSDDIDGLIIDDQSPDNLAKCAQQLLQRSSEFIPDIFEHVDIKDCTLGIGVRPYPKDGKSIVGPMPDAKRLYIVATHSGITLAPAIAQLMTEMLNSDAPPSALIPFGIDRFCGFGGSI